VEDGQVATSLNCVKSVSMFLFIMFTNLAF
jgi:hypothetical protein